VDEPKANDEALTNLLGIAIGLIFLFSLVGLFTDVGSFFRNYFGVELPFLSSGTTGTTGTGSVTSSHLSPDISLGSRVRTLRAGSIFSSPGGAVTRALTQGARGTLIGGPERDSSGTLWWQVRYDDGTVGWVPDDALAADPLQDAYALHDDQGRGTKVRSIKKESAVRAIPHTTGALLGTQRVGGKGTVLDGPRIDEDGFRWWYVDFERGADGWVHEYDLARDSKRDTLAVKEGTLLGTPVTNLKKMTLYSTPTGVGKSAVGTVAPEQSATLIGGPVTDASGVLWWQVRFEDGSEGWVSEQDVILFTRAETQRRVLRSLKLASSILSLFFVATIGFSVVRIVQLRQRGERFHRPFEIAADEKARLQTERPTHNPRWERLQEYLQSENQNDWRTAILEADVLLDELLNISGYRGATMADKLQQVERSDFTTLDKAWEAHKVRNQIAHLTADEFLLSKREVERIMRLYQDVFNEFAFI
jgi:hypothetical protein